MCPLRDYSRPSFPYSLLRTSPFVRVSIQNKLSSNAAGRLSSQATDRKRRRKRKTRTRSWRTRRTSSAGV